MSVQTTKRNKIEVHCLTVGPFQENTFVVVHNNQKISIIPKAALEKWKKATDTLDDAWVADMTSKGMDGKGMLQTATDLIKQYTK